jgi:hypothetical protein
MSLTGRDLVSASMRLIGAIASGETPSNAEATDGLASINRMIDSWSNEGLMIYAIAEESPIPLAGGQSSYTLGSGGDLATRPQEIERAVVRVNNVDYPVEILSVDQWSEIISKTIQSSIPQALYDDGGYPQRTLKLYPVPTGGGSLILWTKRTLATITSLNTTLSFPPGYEQALVYNGAIQLSPEYGKTPSEVVAAIAIQSKADIKRMNSRPQYLECDSAMLDHGPFNILNGGYFR